MEIIISHVNLDFDSLAAMVAAQKLYPHARMVLPTAMGRNVREFIQLHRDILDYTDAREIDRAKVKRVILVDTRQLNRFGELQDVFKRRGIEVFAFDHHPPSGDDVKILYDYSQETGATTTILIKILRDRQIGISPFEATLFALGIHEDTGSLTYPSTTYDDAEALAYLMMKRANTRVIHRFLDFSLDPEQQDLLGELLKSAHTVDIKGVLVLFTRARVKAYVDAASALTHKVGDLQNSDVVITLLELKDRVNIIGRSRLGDIDIADILAAFGGGGHPQAASAAIKARELDKLEEDIIAEIAKKVRQGQTAKDIMSRLIHTMDIATSVKEARDQLRRYGLTGMPVTQKGRLVGMITAKELEAAVDHELAHAPVKGFLARNVITISPDTPLAEVQDLLSDSDIDRLPVLKEGRIVGILSRREILRKIHGPSYRLPVKAPFEPSKRFSRTEISARLDALLPHKVRELLTRLGEIADGAGLNVYIVGGFVRDLLMNHRNLDIDLVVEGQGGELARAVVGPLGGRLTHHEKFGTSVVILPDGFRIDIASARTEFYEHPAALPQVELGSIRQDLFRRDFTINAMAVSLNKTNFGDLLDYFGGEEDISERKVRVLHELSFIDDPTRIFRAVRFEQRYGFQMSTETEELVKSAVRMELIGRLTGVRIRDELIALLNEPAPWQALKRLDELGVLASLNKKLTVDQAAENRLREVANAIERFKKHIRHPFRRWLAFLIAFVERMPAKSVEVFLATLMMRREDTETVVAALKAPPSHLKALGKEGLPNSQIHRHLKDLSEEGLVYLYARTPRLARGYITRYVDIRDTKPDVTGTDLIAMGQKPSKEFGVVLERLLEAKLDGKVATREDQLALAADLFRRRK